MLLWVFVGITAASVFVIAAVAVGKVTEELAVRPPVTVFDLETAIDFVAANLADEVTAQVSYAEVELVIGWYLDYLELKGVATQATPSGSLSDLVLVPDDESIAWVLGRVTEAEIDLTDEYCVAIIEAIFRYQREIGGFGQKVTGPDEPRPGA